MLDRQNESFPVVFFFFLVSKSASNLKTVGCQPASASYEFELLCGIKLPPTGYYLTFFDAVG